VNANNPVTVIRNPNGTIAYVNTTYANLGTLTTIGLKSPIASPLARAWIRSRCRATLRACGTSSWTRTAPSTIMPTAMALYSSPFRTSFPRWKANMDLAWNYRKVTTDLSWQYTGTYSNFAAGVIGLSGYDPSVASYGQFNLTVAYTCHLRV
jgi:iron complex outermembrane receptor protein